uniref:Putative secreted protein n=1 Tax=Amblyomma triste TaxID=251400 RepID=A0A023G4P9_AMBTT
MKSAIPFAFIVFAMVMTAKGQIPSGSLRQRPGSGLGQGLGPVVQGQRLRPGVQGQRLGPGVQGQRPGAVVQGQAFANGQGYGQPQGRPRPVPSPCLGPCSFGQNLGEPCGLGCQCGVSFIRTPDPHGRLQCVAKL